MNQLEKNEHYDNQTFEDIKHINENGIEYWYARELMPVLQYAKWENFKKVIEKAIIACKNSEISVKDCFLDVRKPIISGIRNTIKELGGTMPEDLPTPKKSLKQLEKENKKSIKKS